MVFKCVVLMPAALAGGLWLSRAIALSPGDASKRALVSNIAAVMQVPLEEGWAWTEQVYGSVLLATDLTPNLGLCWYFFMEIFDHFRDFFLLTFNVHLACYVLPFSIKYRCVPSTDRFPHNDGYTDVTLVRPWLWQIQARSALRHHAHERCDRRVQELSYAQ